MNSVANLSEHERASQAWQDPKAKKAWLGAAIILAKTPEVSIRRPVCGQSNLVVTDARAGDIVERHVSCPVCKNRSAMRMSLALGDRPSSG
jgi:hypothetical protein